MPSGWIGDLPGRRKVLGVIGGAVAATGMVQAGVTGLERRPAHAQVNQQPAPPTDIYLLIGQSNMAGRAAIESVDVPAPAGVSLFNADDAWEPAANQPYGLNRHSTVRKELSVQRLGPGRAFGARLTAETGTELGLVVNARGGTTVANWSRTDHTGEFALYDEAVARAQAALAATPGGLLAGIIWHQGEGDNNAGAVEYYLPTLSDIVDGLRTELHAPDAVFVAGEVGVWRGRGQHINPLIQQVPDVIDQAAWVSSEGLASLDEANNDPHFDSASQRILGTRYADAVLGLTIGRIGAGHGYRTPH